MSPIRTLLLLAALPLFPACASMPGGNAPVWRAETIDPGRPLPTLVASGVYDYFVPERGAVEVDVDDLELIGEAALAFAEEHPDEVLRLARGAVKDVQALNAAVAAVERIGPQLHAEMLAKLGAMGFSLETDGTRASKLEGGGIGTVDAAYVATGTAAVPFGDFPLFGPGSKSSIVGRLGSGLPDEAYVSIHVQLRLAGNRADGDGRATISVMALGAEGDIVFRAKTSGASAGGADADPDSTLRAAFDAALTRLELPV